MISHNTTENGAPIVGKPSYHKGFIIRPVFIYGNGSMDVEYYKLEDPEVGGRVYKGTIEKVKEEINERIAED